MGEPAARSSPKSRDERGTALYPLAHIFGNVGRAICHRWHMLPIVQAIGDDGEILPLREMRAKQKWPAQRLTISVNADC